MPPPPPATTATVRVILLRHGEREDETEDYERRRHSYQEKIDPALTALGHRQALHAWQNILRALEELPLEEDDDSNENGATPKRQRRVMVATSPLKRCMGTAVMVAAAAKDDGVASNIEFVLPKQNNRTTTSRYRNNTDIPVLIMNGLADCAAQMQGMGGVGKVVQEGWLQCAASPSNDDTGHEEHISEERLTPLRKCLGGICRIATEVLNVSEKPGEEQHPLPRGDSRAEAPSMTALQFLPMIHSRPIQFWRETQSYYGDIVPMTSTPQTLQDYAVTKPSTEYFPSRNNNDDIPRAMQPNALADEDEACELALDRAVVQAVRAGADTCVLVTHREAIRFLEKIKTQEYSSSRLVKEEGRRRRLYQESRRWIRMYCCVGVYKVQVNTTSSISDRDQSMTPTNDVEWFSQGVFPYQLLDASKLT